MEFDVDSIRLQRLGERIREETIVRLFLSYEGALLEADGRLDAALPGLLAGLVRRPNLFPVVLSQRDGQSLARLLPVEGLILAGRDGLEILEPDEDPLRLDRRLRLPSTAPAALRSALTGWVLANRTPDDALAVYIGAGPPDEQAFDLVCAAGGQAVKVGEAGEDGCRSWLPDPPAVRAFLTALTSSG